MKTFDLSEVIDRVFVSKSGDEFGPIRESDSGPDELPTGWEAIAEDSCGNYFVLSESQRIAFWDHETAELEVLADDFAAFVTGCIEEKEVELDPSNVISVWIDPDFAAEQGISVPPGQPRKPKR